MDKLIYIFIDLFLHYQYQDNKPDYTCYQMKHDPEHYLNYAFVLDIQWTFAGISRINALIDTQLGMDLSLLKWMKLTDKLIFLFILYQYLWIKLNY